MAGAVAASASACGLRIGRGAPSTLPSASPEEARRDGLARQAMLIGSTAGVLVDSDGANAALYEELRSQAEEQLAALGGVWQPWPSDAPTDLPTTTPLPSAAADASAADLMTVLAEATTAARQAATESVPGVEGAAVASASSPTREASAASTAGAGSAAGGDEGAAEASSPAAMYASLAASWSVAAARLSAATSVENAASAGAAREGSSLEAPLPEALLETYDGARFALETVAARIGEPERSRASSEANVMEGVVLASLALGGTDSRLAAYAWPVAAKDGASLAVTWARESWARIVSQELASFAALTGESASLTALEQSVDAAIDAAHRMRAWGGMVSALPGVTLSQG